MLLADPHAGFRQVLRQFLAFETDMELVGEAADGEEGIDKVRALIPNVVLLDASLAGMNTLKVAQEMNELGLGVKIILAVAEEHDEYDAAVRERTVCAYILKQRVVEDLIPLIREAAKC